MKNGRLKIGWVSATPYARTGYGVETAAVCSRLLEKHDVVCIGQTGDVTVWGGRQKIDTPNGELPIIALALTGSAAELINAYYIPEFKFDLIIGFMDAFGIEFLNDVHVPVFGWIPIDGPFTDKWRNYVRNYHKVIAYSKFGYNELLKWLPPSKVGYIQHGVPKEFKPLGKDAIRADLEDPSKFNLTGGIPSEAFLAINVAANVGPRKNLPLLMWTFKHFVEKGYNGYLLVHTNPYARFPQGYDLITWRRMLGMEERIILPRYDPILKPVSTQTLAKFYSAADVYVQNSDAEGYGMSLAEALACATPLIAPLNSAMTEMVTGHGWGVKCIPFEAYHEIPVYVPMLTEYPKPDQRSLLEKLEEAYNSPKKRKTYGRAGRKFVLENYNWDIIMKKWFKVLDGFQQEQEFFKQIALCLT